MIKIDLKNVECSFSKDKDVLTLELVTLLSVLNEMALSAEELKFALNTAIELNEEEQDSLEGFRRFLLIKALSGDDKARKILEEDAKNGKRTDC